MERTLRPKGLFFIDPYGYKDINPEDIKRILKNRDTEIILFLPISHMYRFAEKSIHDPLAGTIPLKQFLEKLYGSLKPKFISTHDFIDSLENKFRLFLSDLDIFITSYKIERDASKVYALFFFTSHIYGLHKMVEAKWKMDENFGDGFKWNSSPMLFSKVELSNYSQKIFEYIESNSPTNDEVYRFCLEEGFLPKHTNPILNELRKAERIKRKSLDSKEVKGNYLNHKKKRLIQFIFVK